MLLPGQSHLDAIAERIHAGRAHFHGSLVLLADDLGVQRLRLQAFLESAMLPRVDAERFLRNVAWGAGVELDWLRQQRASAVTGVEPEAGRRNIWWWINWAIGGETR